MTHPTSRSYPVAVWAALVATTALSWWLGTEHGLGVDTATSLVIVAAFAKVLLVGHSFMELRDSTRLLWAIFAGWSVLVCITLVTLNLAL
jgi:heme/copper-type cytochrome/quinol oxidase subunit 4